MAISLALAIGIIANAPSAVAVGPALGTYQVIVIPITTGLGSSGVTLANSQALIKRLSQGYSDATGGKITFSLKSVLPTVFVTTSAVRGNNVDEVQQIYAKLGLSLSPDPGYASLIIVGVVHEDKTLSYAGMANEPGQFVIINGTWTQASNLSDLAHEVGHTLGLPHSNTLTCPSYSKMPICGFATEYGDQSDVMGKYMISYYESAGLVRFSALNLDRLGVLAASQKTEVSASGTFTLAPVYGKETSGLKLIYLPVSNHDTYAIEYRPAVGVEKQLSATKMQVPGSKAFWNLSPAFGVQIRLVASAADWTKAYGSLAGNFIGDSAAASDYTSEASAVLSAPRAKQAGLLPGQSYGLSDGSKVSVVSIDPAHGAVVQITRPTDNVAPTINLPSLTWTEPDNSHMCQRAQIDPTTSVSNWPSIQTGPMMISDNRKIAKEEMEVNGSIVAAVITRDDAGKTIMTYRPNTIGTFHVRILAADISGNSSVSGTVDISSMAPPDPNAMVSMTFADAVWESDACGDLTVQRINNVLQQWPTITTSISAQDWISHGLTGARMQVNGVNVTTQDAVDSEGTHTLSYTTSSVGEFTALVVTTSAGANDVQSAPTTFTSSYYQINKPWSIYASSGTTSDGAITISASGADSYTLINISGGSVTRTDATNFLVSGVGIGKTFTATLLGTDTNGNSDGGSPISVISSAPSCTLTDCYVGQEWVMTPGYSYSGTGKQILTIQELVTGKWVLVTKIKLSLYAGGGDQYYPYTYVFRKTFTEAGVHSYREFEGSAYKAGAITSKVFTLTIHP